VRWVCPIPRSDPSWILRDDQADLLDARPAFELFLPCDGGSDFSVALEIDEFFDLVLRGKAAFVTPCFVLAGTEFNLGRYAYVEFLKGAGEDVYVGLLDHSRIIAGFDGEQATARAKCGGLSTARRTMRLSVASVEMTILGGCKALVR
jgi:hypothetical protein